MLRKNICIPTTACIIALALAMACSRSPETPVAPSGAESGNSDAGADGSTLKVTAPTPKSPVNGQQPDGSLVLTAGAASGKFADVGPLSYRFQIINAGNAVVCNITDAARRSSIIVRRNLSPGVEHSRHTIVLAWSVEA